MNNYIKKIVLLWICTSCLFALWQIHTDYITNMNNAISLSKQRVSIKLSRQIAARFSKNRMTPSSLQLSLVQSVQETSYFCVPACLQMVLRYHGIHRSQAQLAMEMHTKAATGTEYDDLARVVNTYLFSNAANPSELIGYHLQLLDRYDHDPWISTTFEQRVRFDIDHNDPVFAAIDVHTLYPNLSSANHMIVIVGYTLAANADTIAYYFYVDPSYLVQDDNFGGLKTVAKAQMMRAILINEEPAYLW